MPVLAERLERASFTNLGVYTLRLTASDTEFIVSDDITITVLLNVLRLMGLAFCVCKIGRAIPGYEPPTVEGNKTTGDDFRDALRDLFQALGYDTDIEVPHSTPWGRRIIDIELRKGGWTGGIEGQGGWFSLQTLSTNQGCLVKS
jgi:hypothetical protein